MIGFLLGLGISISSFVISTKLTTSRYKKFMIDIVTKGNKLSSSKFNSILDKAGEHIYEEDNSKLKGVLDSFLLLLPIVNIIYSTSIDKKNIEKAKELLETSNSLVPLTEQEKRIFSSIEDKEMKLMYCFKLFSRQDKCEKDQLKLKQQKSKELEIENNPIPLTITLSELKEISTKHNLLYRLGYIGINNDIVAILTDTLVQEEINTLKLTNKNIMTIVEFENINEEEIGNKTITIYPHSLKNRQDINRSLKEISKSKKNIISSLIPNSLELSSKCFPSTYNLKEVEQFNNSLDKTYRLGTYKGQKTAIIGIPNPNYKVTNVLYTADNDFDSDLFIPIVESIDEYTEFTVYSWNTSLDSNQSLQKTYQNIINQRKELIENKIVDNKIIPNLKQKTAK